MSSQNALQKMQILGAIIKMAMCASHQHSKQHITQKPCKLDQINRRAPKITPIPDLVADSRSPLPVQVSHFPLPRIHHEKIVRSHFLASHFLAYSLLCAVHVSSQLTSIKHTHTHTYTHTHTNTNTNPHTHKCTHSVAPTITFSGVQMQ